MSKISKKKKIVFVGAGVFVLLTLVAIIVFIPYLTVEVTVTENKTIEIAQVKNVFEPNTEANDFIIGWIRGGIEAGNTRETSNVVQALTPYTWTSTSTMCLQGGLGGFGGRGFYDYGGISIFQEVPNTIEYRISERNAIIKYYEEKTVNNTIRIHLADGDGRVQVLENVSSYELKKICKSQLVGVKVNTVTEKALRTVIREELIRKKISLFQFMTSDYGGGKAK